MVTTVCTEAILKRTFVNIKNVFLRGVCTFKCRLLSEVPDRNTWVFLGAGIAAVDVVLCSSDPVTLTNLSQLLGQGDYSLALMCHNGINGLKWHQTLTAQAGNEDTVEEYVQMWDSCAGRRMWGAVVPMQCSSCSSCLWSTHFPPYPASSEFPAHGD